MPSLDARRLAWFSAALAGCPFDAVDSSRATTPSTLSADVVAAGDDFSCALSSGVVRCWGARSDALVAPAGPFTHIDAGDDRVCGLQRDAQMRCWGGISSFFVDSPSGVTFSSIAAGGDAICGILQSGELQCFGAGSGAPTGDVVRAVSVGNSQSCAIMDGGELQCWDSWGEPVPPAPPGPFRTLAVGGEHACALRDSGEAVCWGDGAHHQLDVPAGARFASLTAGSTFTCGLSAEGAVSCWGERFGLRGTTAVWVPMESPVVRYRQIDAGAFHVCGVAVDDRVHCWGDDMYGQSDVP